MINGIQHIGMGVVDREKAHAFYKNALGFAVPLSKHSGDCSGVRPIIGTTEERNVVIALNAWGGALVELFQYTSKTPVPAPGWVDFTCNGFLFYGLKARNVEGSLERIESHGGRRVTEPSPFTPMAGAGWRTAVFLDPGGVHGMLLEYPGSNVGRGDGRPRVGGVEYVAIGVSELDRSVEFYGRVLGYDRVVYRTEGVFSEWEPLFGKGRRVARALLTRSSRPQGRFRHYLRGGMVELVQVEGNKGRNNFEERHWGDIGLMELCFDVTDIHDTIDGFEKQRVKLVAGPYVQIMGKKTKAVFAYIRDPDGSLLEFAETIKLPYPYLLIRAFVNPFIVGIAKSLGLL